MGSRNIFYVICGCLLAFAACNDDDMAELKPSYADRNWFEILDKPGVWNSLAYEIYQETGMALFINDILGEEVYTVNVSGDSLYREERFSLFYWLFGSTEDQEDEDGEQTMYVVQSRDTTDMIDAANLIRSKVLPYIPKTGAGRPKCYFLVDSINDIDKLVINGTYYDAPISKHLQVGLKGVAVGQLNALSGMTEEERELWCARIIASKATSWMLSPEDNNGTIDLVPWYTITDEGRIPLARDTWYGVIGSQGGMAIEANDSEYNVDLPMMAGIFDWRHDGFETKNSTTGEIRKYRIPQDQESDVLEYVARVYAYRDREEEFLARYSGYYKVIRKFNMMRDLVDKYEEVVGIRQ